jgi:hypothetical protein
MMWTMTNGLDPADQAVHAEMVRSFHRAAVCSRFVGIAALAVGALATLSLRQLPAETSMFTRALHLLIIVLFSVPGLMYLLLATWVGRQRLWAARLMFLLAMLDMTLLGVIFVTFWGSRRSISICAVSALFVVTLGILSGFLGRGLESCKRLQMRRPLNPPLPDGR